MLYRPFLAARLFTSLDRLTGGRVGMTIVTSVTDRVAQSFGYEQHLDQDERYVPASVHWRHGAAAFAAIDAAGRCGACRIRPAVRAHGLRAAMLYALERGISADAFVVYTDSETWAGAMHPVQALRQYRARTGIADLNGQD
jgi:hypothetical protein